MAALVGVLLLSVFVVSGAAVGGTASPSAATVVKVAFNKKLKKAIVVDGRGRTLYMFTADAKGKPTCITALNPGCEQLWPPLTSKGTPVAGKGIIASKLDVMKRSDGKRQVRYNRHPLYFYVNDPKPGAANGQDLYGVWYVLSPKGTPIRK